MPTSTASVAVSSSAAPAASAPAGGPSHLAPKVIAKIPHDPAAFTQGLVYVDSTFLEGTGQYGESTLRRVDATTGKVLRSQALSTGVFGEGLARQDGELFELTWQEHVCFVWDEASFAKKRELHYDGEGWGITNDGHGLLITSDGSAELRFREPGDFHEVRHVTVHDGGRTFTNVNELELVRSEVFANIWQTTTIVRIDPNDGHITGYLDMSGLPEPPHDDDPDAVLNGIAYDAASNRLWVTGKRWRFVYEIETPAL